MRRTFVYCLLVLALLVPGVTWIAQRSGGTVSPVGITAVHAARDAMVSHSASGSRLAVVASDTPTSTTTSTGTSTGTPTNTATPTNTGSPTQTGTATNTGTVTNTGTTTQTSTVTSTPTIGSATTTSTATTTGTVIVGPTLSLSTAAAFPGAQVVVTGSNFAPNATITLLLGSITLATVNGQPVVSSNNGAFSVTVIIPATAATGVYTLSAQDQVHGLVGVTINVLTGGTVTPTGTVLSGNFTLSPAAGVPGSAVSIVVPAGGFPSGSSVTVVFRDVSTANASTTLGTGIANADGSFTFNGSLPAQAVAGNAAIVLSAGSTSLARTFTVQPRLTLNPASAAPGAAIQVSGAGFAANATITFTVAGLPGGVTTISSGAGSFSTTLTIPATAAAGAVNVVASDGTNVANASLAMSGQGGVPTATPGGVVGLPTFPIPAASATPVPGGTVSGPFTLSFAEGYTGQASTNGKATFSEVLNLLNPGTTPAALTISYYVQGNAVPQVVNRTVAANSTLRESVNTDVGLDKVVSAVVRSAQRIYATRTITRTAPSTGPLDGSTTQAARAASLTWYFPEGFTGVSFQEYLTLLNPSSSTAHVLIRLAPQATSGSNARTVTLTVPPLSRATANIRALNQGGKATSVAMIVSSDQPVVAERVEYFGSGAGSGKFGSTVSLGQTSPAQQLRIAYGSSGGAQLVKGKLQPVGDQDYITLLNPSTNLAAAPVQVTVGFSDSSGHTLGQPVVVPVAPGTRQTVGANVTIGTRAAGPFSVSLSASGPIVAESAQYFGGSPNIGSTPGVAFPAYSAALLDGLLSELSTSSASGAPINRQVFLYNPNGAPLQMTATYFGANGTLRQASYSVPASGIAVVNVNQGATGLPAGPLGAEFKLNGGSGGFVAYAVGKTTDGRSATEDSAQLPQ